MLGLGAGLLVLGFGSSARAYSDPASYELPIEEGGGGGRWFTGSVADGYGCQVCHVATADLTVSVTGLPEGGYVPGQAYEIGVSWPEAVEHLAAVLELVDETGRTAGSLLAPRPDAVQPNERCNRMGLDVPGTMIFDAESGRQFAAAIDCGSRAMRMLWTAPSVPSGTIWLHGGFVAADDSATVDGDVAVLIRRSLPPAGVALPDAELIVSHGCHVGREPTTASGAWGWLEWLVPLAWGMWRRGGGLRR